MLGISSGAKMLLAVVTIALSGTMTQIPVSLTVAAAFIGSMLSMLLVLVFARKIKNMSSLLVIGIMISNICSAVTDFLINFAKEADIVNLTYWSMGTFSGKSWNDLKISSIIVIITLIVTFFMSKPIGAYQLGEGYAKSMGINIKAFRVVLIVLSSMLSACVTAFAGPIAFVGIAVPHIAKLMFGTAKPIVMIPGVFLTGAIFCMFATFVARTRLFSDGAYARNGDCGGWRACRNLADAEAQKRGVSVGYYFKTEKLTVGYDGKPLISDIDIGIEKGEILTLIGPNGSGKSTILKSITRHLESISGVVSIDGADMRRMSRPRRGDKAFCGAHGADQSGAYDLRGYRRHRPLSLYKPFWASDRKRPRNRAGFLEKGSRNRALR